MADAGLSFDATNFRVDVVMDPDWIKNWQGYESHVVLSSSDVIDRIKHKIARELWMLHARWLRPETFHLVQRELHLPYYFPVTSYATGHPVSIVRNPWPSHALFSPLLDQVIWRITSISPKL